MRSGIVAASAVFVMLSGCARDVVLKPAVVDFVDKAKTATATAAQVYAKIDTDREMAVAITLAANRQCGLVTMYAHRRPADNDLLSTPAAKVAAERYKAKHSLRDFSVPHKDLICLTPDEVEIIEAVDGNYKLERVDIRAAASLPVTDFKPQLDTINALIDYIAALAKSAGQPNLVIKDDITNVVTQLNTVVTDGTSAANGLGLLAAAGQTNVTDVQGQITKYSGAVGNLANDIETYVKQGHDVRSIRDKLLHDDTFDKHAGEAAYDADCWFVYDLALQRDNFVRTVDADSDYTQQPFATRLDLAQKFLVNAKVIDQKAQCSTSPASAGTTAAKLDLPPAPGEMIRQLIASRHELLDIATNDQGLTSDQRRDEVKATLSRLASTLAHIAAIAAFFL